jgi:hypothetical protein
MTRIACELPTISTRLALAALSLTTSVLAGTQLATCEAPYPDPAPGLAAGADRFTVAWVHPRRKGGSLQLQQFDARSQKPLSAPTTIVRRDDLVARGVELLAFRDGYLAISRVVDPEKKPHGATHLLTVPLDARGRPTDEPHTLGVDYACPGASVVESFAVIAYVEIARSHRYPYDTLGLLAVGRQGQYLGHMSVANSPRACASAARGRTVALVWTRLIENSGAIRATLHVSFQELRDQPQTLTAELTATIPISEVGAGPVRIVPLGSDWAVLHSDPHDHVHVAVIDSHAKLLRRHTLPRSVDPETADLSINDRGLFVTWISRGRAHIIGLDGKTRLTRPAGSKTSTTRALGAGAGCVTAWTQRSRRARLAAVDRCP